MIIISIDVGIKNLAYCILQLNEKIEILDWNIINLTNIEENNEKLINNKSKTKSKSNTENLVTLGINLKKYFDKNEFIKNIDLILIENQIGPIANKMKSIQGMIAQYFICNNQNNIIFVSAINKLKPFLTDKKSPNNKDYKARKAYGIEVMRNILTKNESLFLWIDYFNLHNKKDDLSDSFLQCISYLLINKRLSNILF